MKEKMPLTTKEVLEDITENTWNPQTSSITGTNEPQAATYKLLQSSRHVTTNHSLMYPPGLLTVMFWPMLQLSPFITEVIPTVNYIALDVDSFLT